MTCRPSGVDSATRRTRRSAIDKREDRTGEAVELRCVVYSPPRYQSPIRPVRAREGRLPVAQSHWRRRRLSWMRDLCRRRASTKVLDQVSHVRSAAQRAQAPGVSVPFRVLYQARRAEHCYIACTPRSPSGTAPAEQQPCYLRRQRLSHRNAPSSIRFRR